MDMSTGYGGGGGAMIDRVLSHQQDNGGAPPGQHTLLIFTAEVRLAAQSSLAAHP